MAESPPSPSSIRRNARKALVLATVPTVVLMALQPLLFVGQSLLIFRPGDELADRPTDRGWDYKGLSLRSGGGSTCAWYMATENALGTVLYSHGNAGTMSDCLDDIEVYRRLGFNVLLYDYGGYGDSSGFPSEWRCYRDIRACWRYLTEDLKHDPAGIVLVGRSLGSGPTCQLATEVIPAAVILESGFHSVARSAREEYPYNPLRLILWHRFDNAAKVPRIQCPILFIHSPDDEAIPIEHARTLYELANEPKQFLEIRGGHNSAYVASRPHYEEGLRAFLGSLSL